MALVHCKGGCFHCQCKIMQQLLVLAKDVSVAGWSIIWWLEEFFGGCTSTTREHTLTSLPTSTNNTNSW